MFSNHEHPFDVFSSNEEGQLSVDVFRDENELVIVSTMAGVKPEDVDVSVHGDLLTIRGKRSLDKQVSQEHWFYRECFWGSFSRSVVLPYDVAGDSAKASLKDGLLTVRIPIQSKGKKVDVTVE